MSINKCRVIPRAGKKNNDAIILFIFFDFDFFARAKKPRVLGVFY